MKGTQCRELHPVTYGLRVLCFQNFRVSGFSDFRGLGLVVQGLGVLG